MGELSWGVWGLRFGITVVTTTALAWTVSFKVSDYVVRANTSSANEAMRALQSSIDRLNETVMANNAQLQIINGKVADVAKDTALQVYNRQRFSAPP